MRIWVRSPNSATRMTVKLVPAIRQNVGLVSRSLSPSSCWPRSSMIAPKANRRATTTSTGRCGSSVSRVPAVTARATWTVKAAAVPANAQSGRRQRAPSRTEASAVLSGSSAGKMMPNVVSATARSKFTAAPARPGSGLGLGAGGVPFRRALGPWAHLGLRRHILLRGRGLRHRYQVLEQPRGVTVLRIPLNAQAPSMSLQFDGLNHLIQGPGHAKQPTADSIDGLVVRRRHLRGVAEDTPEFAAGGDLHVMGGQLDRIRVVGLVADAVRQVLDQRPAAGHVQHMHATPDGQEGKVGVDGGPGQDQLDPIPAMVGHVG